MDSTVEDWSAALASSCSSEDIYKRNGHVHASIKHTRHAGHAGYTGTHATEVTFRLPINFMVLCRPFCDPTSSFSAVGLCPTSCAVANHATARLPKNVSFLPAVSTITGLHGTRVARLVLHDAAQCKQRGVSACVQTSTGEEPSRNKEHTCLIQEDIRAARVTVLANSSSTVSSIVRFRIQYHVSPSSP
jgi:hypothetical protein